jgi:hypothetical protein
MCSFYRLIARETLTADDKFVNIPLKLIMCRITGIRYTLL